MEGKRRLLIFQFEKIKCIDEGDGPGNAEPYLWTAFIKMGGDEIRQDPDDPFRLVGTPEFKFGPDSHGNLGTRSVAAGDLVAIPPALGAFAANIRPIQLEVLGLSISIPGVIAAIAVLMEEDNVSDSAAEAGHQALNNLIKNSIEGFISRLNLLEIIEEAVRNGQSVPEVIQQRLGELQKQLVNGDEDEDEDEENKTRSVIKDAIKSDQNLFENLWSWINGDDFVGTHMFLFTTDQLLNEGASNPNPGTSKEMTFSEKLNDPDGDGEYEIFGKVSLSKPVIQVGALPGADPLEISAISKRYSHRYEVDYITHIGGVHNGAPWILHKYTGALLIKNGTRHFFVQAPDGSQTEVITGYHEISGSLYLRSSPNDTTEDNLLSLPELAFYQED